MGFIGVIDSGVGGLTILQQLRQSHSYNYVYIADHAFCPYGTKRNDVLFGRASKLVDYLKCQGAQAVVLACNTVSVFADRLQQTHKLPIYDVITPTCQFVVDNRAIKKVALLATKATITNGAYQSCLAKHGIEVVSFDCSAFVPFVEQRATTTLACQITVHKALRNLPQTQVDAVILGCTHFPLLRRQITYYCHNDKIVQCRCFLPSDIDGASSSTPTVQYLTTGDTDFANTSAACFKDVNFIHVTLS